MNFNYSEANKQMLLDINPVHIVPANQLGIALAADVFFKVSNNDASKIAFPYNDGNLSIDGYAQDTINLSSFPSLVDEYKVAPCASFTFQADAD